MLDNHISKAEAMRRIRELWHPKAELETVDIDEAIGRIAARDYYSMVNIPVVRAAGMDGICVNFDLLEDGIPDASGWVRGREYDRADTGDDFDDRFDTVLPIEWIRPVDEAAVKGERLELAGGLIITPQAGPGGRGPGGPGPGGRDLGKPGKAHPARGAESPAASNAGRADAPALYRGMNVRSAGSMMAKDTHLLKRGMKITPLDISALITGGYSEVHVLRQPVISFIPTGSELIPAGQPLGRGQNYESNSHMVRAMLLQMGARPRLYPIVRDKREALATVLRDAAQTSDIVVISGGSSKGDEDYNAELIASMGTELFHWVKAAPGRPMAASVTDAGKLILNTAGPAMAAYHGIAWCVRELLCDWYGTDIPWGQAVTAVAARDLPAPPLSLLLRLKVEAGEGGQLLATPLGGPGGPKSQPPQYEANAICFTDPDAAPVKAGDRFTVYLVR